MRTNLMSRLGRASAVVAIAGLAIAAVGTSAEAREWNHGWHGGGWNHAWHGAYYNHWRGNYWGPRYAAPVYAAPVYVPRLREVAPGHWVSEFDAT